MKSTKKEESKPKESDSKKVTDSSLTGETTQPTVNKQVNRISSPSVLKNNSKKDERTWNLQALACLFVVGAVSLVIRLNRINKPSETGFEEVTMGKFISSYMKREFSVDVDPPLGKLLYAAVAYLFRYDGSFDFTRLGQSYSNSTVPYVALRAFSAICGTFTVMGVYAILVEMKFMLSIAVLGACLAAFDNALAVQSRFFISDSELLLFLIMSCLSWVKFRSQTKAPFTFNWWFWLSATGIFLGLAMGVKIIGFFVVACIGLCTIFDLWEVSGIAKTPKHISVLYHWLARILCLITVPIVVFLIPFFIHLLIANKSGSQDSYMTNEFQSTLANNQITKSASAVYYGSVVKVANKAELIYLHSHKHKYPHKHSDGKISSQEQQVTGYSHPDHNNDWIIMPEVVDPPIHYIKNPRIQIKHKDVVRFKHVSTGYYLMSHNVASPLTSTNQEVAAIEAADPSHEGYNKTLWEIRISGTTELFNQVSYFGLKHVLTNAYLFNQKEALPDWAFKQREINSGKVKGTDKATWRIEKAAPQNVSNEDNQPLETTEFRDKLNLWKKFVEYLKLPYDRQSNLPVTVPYLASPTKWPILTQGINYWTSEDKKAKVFLLCNPLSWYLCILSLPALISLAAIDVFVYLRGGEFLNSKEKRVLYIKGLFFLTCFFANYFLFAGMGEPVFLNNYTPCYLFSILVFATVYQLAALRFEILSNKALVGLICSLIAGVFTNFSALTYGTSNSEEYFRSLKWNSGWCF